MSHAAPYSVYAVNKTKNQNMKLKAKLQSCLWLSAPDPAAKSGLSLCIVLKDFKVIVLKCNLTIDSWIVRKLDLTPEY